MCLLQQDIRALLTALYSATIAKACDNVSKHGYGAIGAYILHSLGTAAANSVNSPATHSVLEFTSLEDLIASR